MENILINKCYKILFIISNIYINTYLYRITKTNLKHSTISTTITSNHCKGSKAYKVDIF